MKEIKERIKEALELRGMTASELARKSKIDKGAISRYLKGEVIPKQSKVGAMATALNVSPTWLLGYDVDIAIKKNKEIVAVFEQLSPSDQEQVLNYAEYLLKKGTDNGDAKME